MLAFGIPGTGKTHAMRAIGHRLAESSRSVLFIPAYRLVQDMLAAKRDLELPRMLRKLDNFDLLVIDELPPVGRRTRRNLDPKDTWGATPLMLAATSGYPRFVERLLDLGADHGLSDNSGRSALHHAAESVRNEVVGALIDGGAGIHCGDDIGDTPLHMAAARGHESTVRQLLDGGVDIEATNHEGLTALDMAIFNYHMHSYTVGTPPRYLSYHEHNSEAAWALLERGASLDPMRIPVGDRHALWPHLTPDDLLFGSGDIDYSRLPDLPESYREKLPEFRWYSPIHGIRVKYPTISLVMNHFSLLHDAVLKDMPDLILTLLRNGVSPITAVRDSMTPLHVAVRTGNYEIAKMLHDWGADLQAHAHNYRDGRHPHTSNLYDNALDMAITKLWDPEMTRFLFDLGATIDRYSQMTGELWDQVIKSHYPPERREEMIAVLTESGLFD